MKYSVIDIGSNSMRLTVYEAADNTFKILFKEKVMAGLAGYVEDGYMSEEGIQCACEVLLQFKHTLEILHIEDSVAVFATASLRNIYNTDHATARITELTGFQIEVISGEDEVQLSYTGAMQELSLNDGIFVDIGGASTEIAVFSEQYPLFSGSYPIGSLKLYRDCVKKVIPGKGSIKRMEEMIKAVLPDLQGAPFLPQKQMVGTGGTARSILRLARYAGLVSKQEQTMDAKAIHELQHLFLQEDRAVANLILKICPERIHTLIPGFLILSHIAKQFQVEQITVSQYGVREGYLCRKILQ